MKYPNMLNQRIRFMDVEFTNNCNLKCCGCPNSKSKFLRGFIDDATVKLAIKYSRPNQVVSINGLGEPLLHPNLSKYIKWIYDNGLRIWLGTNGLLLTEDLLHKIIRFMRGFIVISLHTEESVEALKMAEKFLIDNRISLNHCKLCGVLLSHNSLARSWINKAGLSPWVKKRIVYISSHDWAGNIDRGMVNCSQDSGKKNNNCEYIRDNFCTIRWDGTVVSCCYDADNLNILGHISNFPKLRHTPDKYKLCSGCRLNIRVQNAF